MTNDELKEYFENEINKFNKKNYVQISMHENYGGLNYTDYNFCRGDNIWEIRKKRK